jgi:hypothetical protein
MLSMALGRFTQAVKPFTTYSCEISGFSRRYVVVRAQPEPRVDEVRAHDLMLPVATRSHLRSKSHPEQIGQFAWCS